MGRRARSFKRNLRMLFAPVQPGEVPSRNYMGYKPNEADGGMWAECGVHGQLKRVRTVSAKFDVEKAHWETEHV